MFKLQECETLGSQIIKKMPVFEILRFPRILGFQDVLVFRLIWYIRIKIEGSQWVQGSENHENRGLWACKRSGLDLTGAPRNRIILHPFLPFFHTFPIRMTQKIATECLDTFLLVFLLACMVRGSVHCSALCRPCQDQDLMDGGDSAGALIPHTPGFLALVIR